MALDESQIVRYSRQILLKEIGGKGQERLLASRIAIDPQRTPALEIASSYLVAAGVRRVEQGGDGTVTLAPATDRPGLQVILGGAGDEARVVFANASVCRACLLRNAELPGEVPAELASILGAVAATVTQRLILGVGAEFGTLAVHRNGVVDEPGWKRCITCG